MNIMPSSQSSDYLISELLPDLAAHLFYFYYTLQDDILPDEGELGWAVIRASFQWAQQHLIEATDPAEVSKLCSALASSLDGDTSPVLPKEVTTGQLCDFFVNASNLGKSVLNIKESVDTYNYEKLQQVFAPNPVSDQFLPEGQEQEYHSVNFIREVLLPVVRTIQAADDPKATLESIISLKEQKTPRAPFARLVYCALGFLGLSPRFCNNVKTNQDVVGRFAWSVLDSGCHQVDFDLEKLRYWTFDHTGLASLLRGCVDDEGDYNDDEADCS